MRKYTVPVSMSVEYFLGDHLGSTSITTDNAGTKVSEMRYKPWGEVRYSWTSTPVTTPSYALSKYTFTGQYSYMDDPSTSGVGEGFGLMFYNARMYDPYLNQFTQPDTIVPGGVQGYDRYAYTANNPVNYTDPSGHVYCGLGLQCGEGEVNGGSPTPPTLGGNSDNNDPDPEDGEGGSSGDGQNNGHCGQSNVVDCPPDPKYTIDIDALTNIPTSNVLHPFDILVGNKNITVAYVPIYSPNGELIGFRLAMYVPDYSTAGFNENLAGSLITNRVDNIISDQLLRTVEIYGSKVMFFAAKRLNAVSNVIDVLSIANNSINITGNLEIVGPIIIPDPANIVENFPNPFVLE